MAMGSDELCENFMEGLVQRPTQHSPDRGGSGRDGTQPGRGRYTDIGSDKAPELIRKSELSLAAPEIARHMAAAFPKLRASHCEENLIERLPCEILMKILAYLDRLSLVRMSYLNKRFSQLTSDDVLWQQIYKSHLRRRCKWMPKREKLVKAEPEEAELKVERHTTGYWKRLYLKAVSRQEVYRWRKELKYISQYTGLPSQTEWVLRKSGVSWELTVSDLSGERVRMEQSRVFFFESSLLVCWSGERWPRFHDFSSVQVHGERSTRRFAWRSLLMQTSGCPVCCLGEDELVKLYFLRPALIVAMWRESGCVAYILLALHFHTLLGSPLCPHSAPGARPPVDQADLQYGLRGYSLHFVLHNTHTRHLWGHFTRLCCHTDWTKGDPLELRVISPTNLSEHRCVMGKICMPWSSDKLLSCVESCCVMSLTLLDEFNKPFWCVSSPARVVPARWPVTQDYEGEHFLLDHSDRGGRVELKLLWLQEQFCSLVVGLSIFLPIWKVNEHFGTNY